ncbi:hypothetical protein As57867_005090, partial [Aphanomyces stellatus]
MRLVLPIVFGATATLASLRGNHENVFYDEPAEYSVEAPLQYDDVQHEYFAQASDKVSYDVPDYDDFPVEKDQLGNIDEYGNPLQVEYDQGPEVEPQYEMGAEEDVNYDAQDDDSAVEMDQPEYDDEVEVNGGVYYGAPVEYASAGSKKEFVPLAVGAGMAVRAAAPYVARAAAPYVARG